jgi:hypothetical protein
MMAIGTEGARQKRDRLDSLAVSSMPHTQAIGRVSGAVLSTSGEQLCSVVRFGRYQGLSTFSIDKGNALVCLSEIAVRGPFAAESRLCFIPCSGGTVIILEYLQLGAETRQKRVLRASDICSCASCHVYAHLRVHATRKRERQAVRSRGPTRREPLLQSLRPWNVRALRSAPQKITLGPCNQPAVHPGKSQRRAVGDASDWLEPQLHVL